MGNFISYKTANGTSHLISKLICNVYNDDTSVSVLTTNGRTIGIVKNSVEEAEREVLDILSNVRHSISSNSTVMLSNEVCTQLDTPTGSTELSGGSAASPVQLSYGNNNVILDPDISEDANSLILPSGRTGKTVTITQYGDFDTAREYNVYPPNSGSSIETLEDGLPFRVSKGETSCTFTCTSNPLVSTWVFTGSGTNVGSPVGQLNIAHTSGAQTNWYGVSGSTTSGGSRINVGTGGIFVNNYNLNIPPSIDYDSIISPTNVYNLVGFRAYTDIPVTDPLNISLNFGQIRVNSQSGYFIPNPSILTHTKTDYDNGFLPSANRFVKSYTHPTLGACYMFDRSGIYQAVGLNYDANNSDLVINAGATTFPPFYTKYGEAGWNFEVNVNSSMATATYNIDMEVDIDILPK